MSVAQVAEHLQIDGATILRWIRSGELPAMHVGKAYRIREDELAAWLETRRGRNPNGIGKGGKGGNLRKVTA